MRLMKNLFLGLVLIVPFLFTGCSKKDTTPQGAANYEAPSIATDTLITIPDAMRTKAESGNNPYLSVGVGQIDALNIWSSDLYGAFNYDQSTEDTWTSTKNSDGSVSYSWTYLQVSIKLTYFNSSSESWWKYEIDSAGHSFPLYYVVDKGTSGEVDWYAQDNFSSQPLLGLKDVWTKSSDGTYNATLTSYDTDGTTVTSKYISVSHADKSGSLDVYSLNGNNQLVLQEHYEWDATGSGSYTFYKSDGTTVDVSGTF